MNKKDHIKHIWTVGGDYFCLYYLRASNTNINYYLDQFNIDDYYIYKSTAKQKQVSIQEFMDFKYSQYIFIRKDKYDKKNIELWLNNFLYIYKGNGGIQYLNKPLPPFDPHKIVIKK